MCKGKAAEIARFLEVLTECLHAARVSKEAGSSCIKNVKMKAAIEGKWVLGRERVSHSR
jgi:hypothetical protein